MAVGVGRITVAIGIATAAAILWVRSVEDGPGESTAFRRDAGPQASADETPMAQRAVPAPVDDFAAPPVRLPTIEVALELRPLVRRYSELIQRSPQESNWLPHESIEQELRGLLRDVESHGSPKEAYRGLLGLVATHSDSAICRFIEPEVEEALLGLAFESPEVAASIVSDLRDHGATSLKRVLVGVVLRSASNRIFGGPFIEFDQAPSALVEVATTTDHQRLFDRILENLAYLDDEDTMERMVAFAFRDRDPSGRRVEITVPLQRWIGLDPTPESKAEILAIVRRWAPGWPAEMSDILKPYPTVWLSRRRNPSVDRDELGELDSYALASGCATEALLGAQPREVEDVGPGDGSLHESP